MKMIEYVYDLYDASVRTFVLRALESIGFEEMAKPPSLITATLPLVRNPTPVVTLIAGYLLVALSGKRWIASVAGGQRARKISRGFQWFILAHNIFLVASLSKLIYNSVNIKV